MSTPIIKVLPIAETKTDNWYADNSVSGNSNSVVERRDLQKLAHELIDEINQQRDDVLERSGVNSAIDALNAQLSKRAPEVLFAPQEIYKSGMMPAFKAVMDGKGNILYYNLEYDGDLVARVSSGGDGAVPSTGEYQVISGYGGDYDGNVDMHTHRKPKKKKPKPISANTLALINRVINPLFGATS